MMKGSDFKKVKRQIENWRRTRRYEHEAMPESIWSEAVRLSRIYSVNQVRRELKLDGTKLKRKAKEKRNEGQSDSTMPGRNFVDVDLSSYFAQEPKEPSNPSFHCEWTRPDGVSLRIQVAPGQINEIVTSFLRGDA